MAVCSAFPVEFRQSTWFISKHICLYLIYIELMTLNNVFVLATDGVITLSPAYGAYLL